MLPLTLLTALLLAATPAAAATDPLADAVKAIEAGRHNQAAQMLLPLANSGNSLAQYRLGMLYYNGQGVPEDEKQAIYWWKQAAAQGYTEAMFQLGSAFLFGSQTAKFVPDPDREAWFNRMLGVDNPEGKSVTRWTNDFAVAPALAAAPAPKP